MAVGSESAAETHSSDPIHVTPAGMPPRRLPALSEPNFRLLLLGDGLSHLGDMIEQVARMWLVFELTNSPLALGVVAFAAGFPRLILALIAGTLADRLDRRKILVYCGAGGFMIQVVFATLVLFDMIEPWHIVAIVLVAAVVHTLNLVTRHAIIPDTVPNESLPNAIALFTTLRGTLNILGPALAGILIVTAGVAGALYVNAASFLVLLTALRFMQIAPAHIPLEKLSFRQDIGRGLAFVWGRKDLLTLVVLGLLPIVLVLPYKTLMPVFARDVLGLGADGYGFLMAAPGVGAVLSAGAVSFFGVRGRGVLMLSSLILASLALFAFALMPWFVPALLALVLLGVAFNLYRILNNTVLQLLTPREMMGRVMGIYQTDKGLQPVGALVLGLVASLFNAPIAIAASAAACLVFTIGVLVLRPSLRKL